MEKWRQKVRDILYQNRDEIDDRVQNGIELYRKGYLKLHFVDKDGRPVQNVHIHGELKKHLFHFGANIFMLKELETPEKNRQYEEYFKELFNMATLPFYWKDLEPEQGHPRYAIGSSRVYRRPPIELCLDFCEKNGIEPKEHCLNYDQWSPDWLDRHDISEIKYQLEKRFAETAKLYSTRIHDWEITNETFFNNNVTDFYFSDDYVEWSYRTADKYFKKNALIINEAMDASWIYFRENRTQYYMQIERLLNMGCRVDKIGMQYHMFWEREAALPYLAIAYDLKRFAHILDRYSEFNRPMQITEITIPAYTTQAADEELQAEILTRLYKLWFSHPKMEAIIYWNMVDGYAAYAPQGSEEGENYYHGGLLRYDFTKKPAYDALHNLIHKEWHTVIDGLATKGEYTFKGFYGEYELEATVNGKVFPFKVTLSPKDNDEKVIVL